MLNCDRSVVQHALQNTQNDCHQWLSRSFRVQQIRFRPGLRPGPRQGTYSAPPDPVAGLKWDPTSKGEGTGEEKDGPLTQFPAPDRAAGLQLRQRRRRSLASRGAKKSFMGAHGERRTRDAEGVEFEVPRVETPKASRG